MCNIRKLEQDRRMEVRSKIQEKQKLKAISGSRRCSHACKLGEIEGGIEYV